MNVYENRYYEPIYRGFSGCNGCNVGGWNCFDLKSHIVDLQHRSQPRLDQTDQNRLLLKRMLEWAGGAYAH